MIKQHKQIVRTFFHSVAFAIPIALALFLSGHRNEAVGFAIGAVLSLFSLYSLGVCVPALFRPGANGSASALLQLLLVMKLPIYAVGLYMATRMGSAAAFAAFAGCALVPAIVSSGAIGKAIVESNRGLRRAAAMHGAVEILPAVEELARQVAELKSDAREPLTVSSQARAVREGAA